MNRLSPGVLPAFYEYDDVPFLVYSDANDKPVAVSDLGIVSTQLPEIVFEGNLIDEARFLEMAHTRGVNLNSDKYKEVAEFAHSFKTQEK